MMRLLIALVAGALFGVGLVVSGMTDTARVRGFLDVAGAWDPTLIFVMGGAILPMAGAWAFARGRRPKLGGDFPTRPDPGIDLRLAAGSVMFGIGWGLSGLCPGPALAAMSANGAGGVVFLAAMAFGMWAAVPVRRHPASAKG